MRKNAAIMLAMTLTGFLLSIDRLPLPIRAQVIPPLSFCCALLLPLVIWSMKRTPLLICSLLFVFFVLVHSVIAVFIDYVLLNADSIRVVAWLRQVVALLSGFSVYLVFRRILPVCSERQIAGGILLGAMPAILVALANVVWGLTGNSLAAAAVRLARNSILRGGLVMSPIPHRAAGLSNEPSSFALYLCSVVIPFLIAYALLHRGKIKPTLIALAVMASLLWTFSTTGFVLLAAVTLAGITFGPHRRFYLGFAALGAIAVAVIIQKIPGNYMLTLFQEMQTSGMVGTGESRIYSTIGPVMKATDSCNLVGYGLGGTSTHFHQMIPESAQKYLAQVSWEGMYNLKTLLGRIFAETGLIGIVLMICAIGCAYFELSRTAAATSGRTPLVSTARIGLFAVVVLSTMGGSVGAPHLCFWLAVADSRFMLSNRAAESLLKRDSDD
jgi:hypothetical protein